MNSLIRNTLTNYLSIGVRMAQGIFLTRWMLEYLGKEYYGLWSLLWTFFAYSLLLDFGFGISAQKYTSTGLFKRDLPTYNRTMSAIFSFHLLMAGIILAGSYAASFFLPELFRVADPEKLAYFKKCFFLFAFGSAVVFPTGMFPELLVGVKRLDIRNYLLIAAKTVELAATWTVFQCGGGLASVIMLSSGMALAVNLAMLCYVPRYIPGFRLSLKVDFRQCREVATFSAFVYVNAISRLLQNKTSRIIISCFCGLEQVGLFHLSGRLSELCLSVASQYQENVRPVVASLFAEKKIDELRIFVVNSMRWNSFIGLMLMVPAAVVTPEAFAFLFKATGDELAYLARLMMAAMFISLAFRQIPYSVLLMTERHKLLSGLMTGNAILTLGLNILLIPRFGIASVGWISIAMALVLFYFGMMPVLLRTLRLSLWRLTWEVYLKPVIPAIPATLALLGMRQTCGEVLGNFGTAAVGGVIYCGIYGVISLFFLLSDTERRKILKKFKLVS